MCNWIEVKARQPRYGQTVILLGPPLAPSATETTTEMIAIAIWRGDRPYTEVRGTPSHWAPLPVSRRKSEIQQRLELADPEIFRACQNAESKLSRIAPLIDWTVEPRDNYVWNVHAETIINGVTFFADRHISDAIFFGSGGATTWPDYICREVVRAFSEELIRKPQKEEHHEDVHRYGVYRTPPEHDTDQPGTARP